MKVGFVTIIGRPNVGKSTLLNNILDYKISIISSTANTTRNKIKGIYNDEESQIIFLDTPGIHKAKQKIGELSNSISFEAISDADLILFLQPSNEKIGEGDIFILDLLKNIKNKTAVISKLDLITENDAMKKSLELKSLGFTDVIGFSSKINESLNHLLNYVKSKLIDGDLIYDNDYLTDLSLRFLAKEIIRESVIENTWDEIPHSVGVFINDFVEPTNNNKYYINANIFVERNSQKTILIGNKGSMIKKIRISAQSKIKEMLDSEIILELNIEVKKNWTSKKEEILKMNY